jgi:hypothetical protein
VSTIRDVVEDDLPASMQEVRRILVERQTLLPSLHAILNGDGLTPEQRALLKASIAKNEHVVGLATYALCGSEETRAARLTDFYLHLSCMIEAELRECGFR